MKQYGSNQGQFGIEADEAQYQAPMFEAGPRLDGYDPSEIEHDRPYIPSGRHAQQPQNPRQQYMNPNQFQPQQQPQPPYQQPPYQQNPQYGAPYQQPQQPQQYNGQAANQAQMGMQGQGPTYQSAEQNLQRMTGVLQNLNQLGIHTTEDGSDLEAYGIGVALDSIYGAIKAMTEAEFWIPQGKQHLVEKFTKAGVPIVKALQTYAKAIEQIR